MQFNIYVLRIPDALMVFSLRREGVNRTIRPEKEPAGKCVKQKSQIIGTANKPTNKTNSFFYESIVFEHKMDL